MRLSAHQPSYIPWLGLLAKIDAVDHFVVLEDVKSSHNSFENRQRLKTNSGAQWLTVPVRRTGEEVCLIKDLEIANDQPWRRKHWRTIEMNYRRAPFFGEYAEQFRSVIFADHESLADLCVSTLLLFLRSFGIKAKMSTSSNTQVDGATERILELCKSHGASEFLFGAGGREYADVDLLLRNDVIPRFQRYEHPTYTQINGPFLPNMGCLDLLMNLGGEAGLRAIRRGHAETS